MNLLITTTEPQARTFNDRAHEFLQATVSGYRANSWSDVYQNADATLFGITWEDRIAGAFTAEELGTVVTEDVTTHANIQDVEWTVVPLPEPTNEPAEPARPDQAQA